MLESRTRVLWWTHEFWPSIGGAEVVEAELALGLKERGYALSVVSQQSGRLPAVDDYAGIPVARFPFHAALETRDVAALADLQLRLRRMVREFAPHLVHLHTLAFPAYFCERVLADLGRPLLVTRHEMLYGAWEMDGVAARVLERADWVACCSEAVLAELRGVMPGIESRSSVVCNGLALAEREPPPIPTKPPLLICVGRLTEAKGFDLAVAALPRIRARHPGARLLIVGDGPARDALGLEAARRGVADAVELPGWVAPSRVPATLERATVVIVPSRGPEAFGLVALQAGQAGRPVVAARRGGLQEVVRDGITGTLFEPGDSEALASAVIELLDDPDRLRRAGEAARTFVRQRFSAERQLEAYDRLYRRLTGIEAQVPTGNGSPVRRGRG